jgi:glycosyltransferase involved in cell wall biosynthesis
MRILFVGHSYLSAYNQKKFVAMKRLNPNLRLRLLVPTNVPERFGRIYYEIHPELKGDEVTALRAWPPNSHMTYLHSPKSVGGVLRSFRPDVIHIVEEPHALSTVETIALRAKFAPQAAITLFTWDNLLRRRRFPLNTVKRQLRAYSLARTQTVVCGNQRAAELLRAEGRFRGSIEIIPQFGLDVTEHQPGSEPELRLRLGLTGSIVIGFAGRLVPEKGLRSLLEALKQLREQPWKLLLVGGGPLEGEIRTIQIEQFPGRIVFVPVVPNEEVAAYLRCADIFVLPSLSTPKWVEQFGLALAQAMMLAIPCVGSSSGAIREVLGPGGIIFEEGNIEQLSLALDELLRSEVQRQQLGIMGREFALRKYAMQPIAARYLAMFERAVGKMPVQQGEARAAVELG